MKKKNRSPKVSSLSAAAMHEKGMALILVILILAFLQVIGLVLLTVTSTGPRVAGNIRRQQQAYNAAEAGFDITWAMIEESFANGSWSRFDGHYFTEINGIDDPLSNNYFRKLTDLELLDLIDSDGDGVANVGFIIYYREPFIQQGGSLDLRYTYTAFLIDDEAAGGTPDPADALLVCIGISGTGSNIITSRLEIELAIQLPGT